MYKRIKKYKLNGKDKSHAKSLIRGLVFDLSRHGKIKTTLAKAKVIKSAFDKLVTKAKNNTEYSRRLIASFFNNNERITNRFIKIVNQYLLNRTSGYTRLIKTVNRKGDNAEMAYIMITDYEPKNNKKRSLVDKIKEKTKK